MSILAEGEDFDVAKTIFDKLKEVPLERRQRILGWVAESLGMSSAVMAPAMQSHPPAAVQQTTPFVAPSHPPAGSLDIKSFVTAKAPKSDTQFAATVAYYYEFEAPAAQRKQSINAQTLQEAARLVGRARPPSPKSTLNNAKAAGYLDGSARGEFAINSVGENLVAMTLPGGTEVTPPSVTKRNRSKAPKKKSSKR